MEEEVSVSLDEAREEGQIIHLDLGGPGGWPDLGSGSHGGNVIALHQDGPPFMESSRFPVENPGRAKEEGLLAPEGIRDAEKEEGGDET
jgi:hypothetical protein